jgi:hypothetical protein
VDTKEEFGGRIAALLQFQKGPPILPGSEEFLTKDRGYIMKS